MDDSVRKELLSNFFRLGNWSLNRCLAPGTACRSPAIQAHSVQNARVLDLLVSDGHVKAIGRRIDGRRGPVFFFDDVGRNQATTFTGLCSSHDSQIFRPVDTNAFQCTAPEHLFLVAYRAVIREVHALMDAVCKTQSTYLKRVDLGLDSGDEPGPAGMLAVDHMIRAYLTHLYKERFDRALVSKDYGGILHEVIRIGHEEPTVAVCSLYSVDGVLRGDDWVRITLNVLPLNASESVAAFSYLPEDAELAKSSLASILNSGGDYQKYLLSKLILNNCENFVLSPAYYDKWSPEKRHSVTDYFTQTLFKGNLDLESQHLYLF